MRVEPFGVDDYVHVYNRGTRKMEITRDTRDKWRFLQALRFFNDTHSSVNILRQLNKLLKSDFESVFKIGWPPNWPQKNPLVKILCYCLMPNHFHLLLKEIVEGGISKFVQKLEIGLTNYFNIKYQESGNLFQGGYRGKRIDGQRYLEYLSVYIQIVNVLELFPGGLEAAFRDINTALKFVKKYPFSSYLDYVGPRKSLIIDKDVLGEIFPTPKDYEEFAYDVVKDRKYEILEGLELC